MNKIKNLIKLILQILPYIDDIIEIIELIIKSIKENGKPQTEDAIKKTINNLNNFENGTN